MRAKLFKNGHSQAVRLPKEFQFTGKEVCIIKFGKGILLQQIPASWHDVYNQLKAIRADDISRDKDLLPQERSWLK